MQTLEIKKQQPALEATLTTTSSRERGIPFALKLIGSIAFALFAARVFSWLGFTHDQLNLPMGTDPLLAILPALNVVPLLSYGWLLLNVITIAAWIRYDPRGLPFSLATFGLFVLIRTVFIALGPVGHPVGMMDIYTDSLLGALLPGRIMFEHEMFFSGHTGLPFLYFLLARNMPRLKWVFLVSSIAMGLGVLLTRNHYTIDVLGAFFMTYAIYALSQKLFGWLCAPREPELPQTKTKSQDWNLN